MSSKKCPDHINKRKVIKLNVKEWNITPFSDNNYLNIAYEEYVPDFGRKIISEMKKCYPYRKK